MGLAPWGFWNLRSLPSGIQFCLSRPVSVQNAREFRSQTLQTRTCLSLPLFLISSPARQVL